MPLALGLLLAVRLSLLLCPFIDDADVLAMFTCGGETGWLASWVLGVPVVLGLFLAIRLSLLLCPSIDDADVLAMFTCGDA